MIALDTYSEVAFDLDSESTDSESDNETGTSPKGNAFHMGRNWSIVSHFFVVYYGSTVSVSSLLICRTEYRC